MLTFISVHVCVYVCSSFFGCDFACCWCCCCYRSSSASFHKSLQWITTHKHWQRTSSSHKTKDFFLLFLFAFRFECVLFKYKLLLSWKLSYHFFEKRFSVHNSSSGVSFLDLFWTQFNFFFAVSPFYFDISSFSNCQQYLNYKFCFIQLLNILHFPFQVLKQFDLYGLFVGVEVHKYKQHNDSFVRFLFCYFRRYFKFLFALFVILCTICVLYTYIYHSGSKTDFFNNWLCFIFERTDFFFASLYFSWNFHSVY